MESEPFKVAYLDRWQHQDGLERIKATPGIELMYKRSSDPQAEVLEHLASAHGYQISSARDELPPPYHATAELLAQCPRLLAVSTTGAGYDTVDVDACTAAGVVAINQSGGNKEAAAEHALAMMLSLSKRVVEADRAMRRDRNWQRNEFLGNDLLGKTVGIVGLGNIGGRVAEICGGAFRMRVLAYDPYLTQEQFRERGAETVSLDELLEQSDFVSVHCPRNAETIGMIGAEQFAAMKPTAYFVTTARGGIHDEGALNQALKRGQVRGAGLDVWDMEPPPIDHPLLALDNVIVSPHTAGVTEESRRNVSLWAVDVWEAIIRGDAPPRMLNPDVWPRVRERFAARAT